MDVMPRPELLLAALFVGVLAHIRAASRVLGKEGMLWLWTQPVHTAAERRARYTFYAWMLSCLVVLLPMPVKIAIAILTSFLFVHLMVLTSRDLWIPRR